MDLAKEIGFSGPYLVTSRNMSCGNEELQKVLGINFTTILRDMKNYSHILKTILRRTTKNLFSRAGFELASSGFYIDRRSSHRVAYREITRRLCL